MVVLILTLTLYGSDLSCHQFIFSFRSSVEMFWVFVNSLCTTPCLLIVDSHINKGTICAKTVRSPFTFFLQEFEAWCRFLLRSKFQQRQQILGWGLGNIKWTDVLQESVVSQASLKENNLVNGDILSPPTAVAQGILSFTFQCQWYLLISKNKFFTWYSFPRKNDDFWVLKVSISVTTPYVRSPWK